MHPYHLNHVYNIGYNIYITLDGAFPGGSDSKESTCNVGDPYLIPELGRFP